MLELGADSNSTDKYDNNLCSLIAKYLKIEVRNKDKLDFNAAVALVESKKLCGPTATLK
ncbi:MAG: hypothetical protein ACI9CE_000006 [Flavobacterium sp.]